MFDEAQAARNRAQFHLAVREQAKRAREYYEATGDRLSLEDVPQLNVVCYAAFSAVEYAAQAIALTCDLPKRFTFVESDYLLIFPPEGKVQIADPHTHQNLCVGLPGWIDPMKVTPNVRT